MKYLVGVAWLLCLLHGELCVARRAVVHVENSIQGVSNYYYAREKELFAAQQFVQLRVLQEHIPKKIKIALVKERRKSGVRDLFRSLKWTAAGVASSAQQNWGAPVFKYLRRYFCNANPEKGWKVCLGHWSSRALLGGSVFLVLHGFTQVLQWSSVWKHYFKADLSDLVAALNDLDDSRELVLL